MLTCSAREPAFVFSGQNGVKYYFYCSIACIIVQFTNIVYQFLHFISTGRNYIHISGFLIRSPSYMGTYNLHKFLGSYVFEFVVERCLFSQGLWQGV